MGADVKKYLYIIYNQCSMQLIYKFNFFVGILSKAVQLFMTVFIWRAIYISNEYAMIKGYTFEAMAIYILINNFSSILFSFEYCFRLGQMIRSGKLTTILLRPIHVLGESFSYYLGNKLIYIIIYIVLSIVMCSQNKGFQIYNLMAYLLLVVINIRMFFMLLSLISTLGFWLIQMWPLRPILTAFYLLLGGVYFPLDLLPEKIYNIISLNPFSLVGHIMTKTIQGFYNTGEILIYCLVSLFWTEVFRFCYSKAMNKGLKLYEGMGS